MGKYLEALKLLYGEDEKTSETPKARTDKTDRRAFVSNVSTIVGAFSIFLSTRLEYWYHLPALFQAVQIIGPMLHHFPPLR